ncbi:FIST signal transduction protein [Aquipuribacter sp. MA13-6]|uniref:FIST signal transduction protein n=1 Tax=unclassified Aquipuribacter TaxID=2635084 RepID=UPI003EEC5F7E
MSTTRWVGVACSALPDHAAAAQDAVDRATTGRDAALVLLFVSPFLDLAAVAGGAARSAPGARVVGCTTSGEIGEGTAGSGRVVAVAMGGVSVGVSVGDLSHGARTAGAQAAGALDGVTGAHRALVLLGDGFAGDRAEMVRGAYGVAGASVALVGGCAGDELQMRATFLLVDGEVVRDRLAGVAIGSAGPIGVGIGHGWRRAGDPVVVTGSDGRSILTLDDRPALDEYLRLTGAPPEASWDEGLWHSVAMTNSFGLPRPGGEEVRAVLGADYEARTLVCSDVPQGTTVWLMDGDADTVQDGTRVAAANVLRGLGGAAPRGVVAFDCVARRAVLGPDGTQAEVELLDELLGGAPLGGFYTYGEFARTSGSRGVHNATLVLLALG